MTYLCSRKANPLLIFLLNLLFSSASNGYFELELEYSYGYWPLFGFKVFGWATTNLIGGTLLIIRAISNWVWPKEIYSNLSALEAHNMEGSVLVLETYQKSEWDIVEKSSINTSKWGFWWFLYLVKSSTILTSVFRYTESIDQCQESYGAAAIILMQKTYLWNKTRVL